MNEQHKNLEVLVDQWIEKAEHDYSAATSLLKSLDEDCPFDIVCFHAQQCAEKFLKAVGTYEQFSIPRTHDLNELLSMMPVSLKQLIQADELAELNPFAVDIRYPGFMEKESREDAVHALEIATHVRSVCSEYLCKK